MTNLWLFRIFNIVWGNLFGVNIGIGNITFADITLGIFIILMLSHFFNMFIHRGE